MNAPIPKVPIRRDNGRWYRPRKITCEAVSDEAAQLAAVIVFGTHNAEAARPFAAESARYWAQPDTAVTTPVAGWWRDAIVSGERTWSVDPAHGRAGVWFDVVDLGGASGG